MKKSYKFDTTLGIIKAECAAIKGSELDEHEKFQEMELPNYSPSLVFEASKIVIDLSHTPISYFSENEVCLFEEENVVKTTQLLFFDGDSLQMLIPFDEFEKFYIDYKRIKFE